MPQLTVGEWLAVILVLWACVMITLALRRW